MAGNGQRRQADESLVGVYESEEEAKKVADRARQAGAPQGAVRIGAPEDEIVSLQAEMQEETDEGWVSPQAAFALTKESAKGLSMLVPILAVVGAVLALPLGLIDVGDLPLWLRMGVAALIGATAGFVIALVVGPSLGSNSPQKRSAAQRGVVVRVDDNSAEVEASMIDGEPLRLDEVRADGSRSSTVTTEEQRTREGTAQKLARNTNADDR